MKRFEEIAPPRQNDSIFFHREIKWCRPLTWKEEEEEKKKEKEEERNKKFAD